MSDGSDDNFLKLDIRDCWVGLVWDREGGNAEAHGLVFLFFSPCV